MYGKEQDVLKELEKQYRKTLDEINVKIRILQSDELTSSKIYQLQYQQALKKQIEGMIEKLHGDQYTTIQEYLHGSYTDGFVGTMYNFAGQGIPIILPINQNAAVKAILTDSKLNESLYDSLGVDANNLKKTIRQEITRGIAGGMSYNDIARNIHAKTKTPLSNAKRIAVTEGHRIQEASAYDAMLEAKKKGVDNTKQWEASLDGDTRPTHRKLDGQIREVEEPFEMDGKKARFPGDFGDPAEDCNCRCTMLKRPRWALDEDELQTLKDRAAFFELDKTKGFEDFKEKYLNASKTLENTGKSDIIKTKEMFKKNSDARSGFKFISNERFDSLTIAAKKSGAIIIRGTEEVEKHLDDLDASASTIGNLLLFKQDVCVSEVLEETYHFTQNIEKVNDDKGEPLRTILNEIAAKEYILDNAEKYKVPRNELDLIKKQLEGYKKQLEDYNAGDKQ